MGLRLLFMPDSIPCEPELSVMKNTVLQDGSILFH